MKLLHTYSLYRLWVSMLRTNILVRSWEVQILESAKNFLKVNLFPNSVEFML